MGIILNLIEGITAPRRCHPEYIYLAKAGDYQFELWSILICRAISEYIRRKLKYKEVATDQFQTWDYMSSRLIYQKTMADALFHWHGIPMFKSVSHYFDKRICEKGIAYDQFRMWIILLWRAISGYIYHKPIRKKGVSSDQFLNLPEDVQCIILSKLPMKEAVRTSVLSRKWRCLWTVFPKLRFDGTTMFGKKIAGKERENYTRQFIKNVNEVLEQCHGRIVEELSIKFEFETLLVDHLNSWVKFAESSHTKFLALDLTPRGIEALDDPQYIFPFHLFDNRSICHLQHIQLHFVAVKLATGFCGFPKLRKLDLYKVHINAKDLEDMLSNCRILEWLSIVHCHMYAELKVQSPLPCLLFLNVAYCELTSMEFHAMKLKTFVYKGSAVPTNLNLVSELRNANIFFAGAAIGDSIPALSNVFTNVQNLTFDIYVSPPEVPCLLENRLMFYHLKHLQLLLSYNSDVDNMSLVPFLGASPFIEKLEIHFSSLFGFFWMKGASIRRFQRTYNYLKDVCITGFKASSGQTEFLVHIVENTPALEVFTVDTSDKLTKGDPLIVMEKEEANFMDAAYGIVRRYIEESVPLKCSVRLLF
ncbi:hypothetical protein ACP4OV_003048 [Aristida adscensionis]